MKSYLPMMQGRVALYQKKSVPDNCGGVVDSWQQIHMVWAAIRLANSRSYTQSQSIGQRVGSHEAKDALYEVVMRHEILLMSGMRLLWNQQWLVIVSQPVRQINKQFQMVFASLLKPSEGGAHV